jgi:hypothetical protein
MLEMTVTQDEIKKWSAKMSKLPEDQLTAILYQPVARTP